MESGREGRKLKKQRGKRNYESDKEKVLWI
jgi:hypothetical protein